MSVSCPLKHGRNADRSRPSGARKSAGYALGGVSLFPGPFNRGGSHFFGSGSQFALVPNFTKLFVCKVLDSNKRVVNGANADQLVCRRSGSRASQRAHDVRHVGEFPNQTRVVELAGSTPLGVAWPIAAPFHPCLSRKVGEFWLAILLNAASSNAA